MKLGKVLVEQIDAKGSIFEDYDQSYRGKQLEEALSEVFNITGKERDCYIAKYRGETFAVYAKSITYLGNPHPTFKKRIQIGDNFKENYRYFENQEIKTLLIGVYKHDDVLILVDFATPTYINRKAHNSSAHVYSYDLQQAFHEQITTKVDAGHNRITIFVPEAVGAFLATKFGAPSTTSGATVFEKKTQAFDFLDKFFSGLPKEWNGIDCYKEMIAANFHRKFQSEWAGAYLEFKFEQYAEAHPEGPIKLHKGHSKSKLDFDIYLRELKSYGDLKCHSLDTSAILGNHKESVMQVIKDSSLYYVVLEHETVKDSELGYVTTHFWNKAKGKKDLMSYHGRMKGKIVLKDYRVLEINHYNVNYLSDFQEGFVNSDGNKRTPKISIKKKDIENFTDYVYEIAPF